MKSFRKAQKNWGTRKTGIGDKKRRQKVTKPKLKYGLFPGRRQKCFPSVDNKPGMENNKQQSHLSKPANDYFFLYKSTYFSNSVQEIFSYY